MSSTPPGRPGQIEFERARDQWTQELLRRKLNQTDFILAIELLGRMPEIKSPTIEYRCLADIARRCRGVNRPEIRRAIQRLEKGGFLVPAVEGRVVFLTVRPPRYWTMKERISKSAHEAARGKAPARDFFPPREFLEALTELEIQSGCRSSASPPDLDLDLDQTDQRDLSDLERREIEKKILNSLADSERAGGWPATWIERIFPAWTVPQLKAAYDCFAERPPGEVKTPGAWILSALKHPEKFGGMSKSSAPRPKADVRHPVSAQQAKTKAEVKEIQRRLAKAMTSGTELSDAELALRARKLAMS